MNHSIVVHRFHCIKNLDEEVARQDFAKSPLRVLNEVKQVAAAFEIRKDDKTTFYGAIEFIVFDSAESMKLQGVLLSLKHLHGSDLIVYG